MSDDPTSVVRQHVRECEQCRESEQRFVSPTEVFGGFAAIPAPPRLRRDLLKRLNRPGRESTRAASDDSRSAFCRANGRLAQLGERLPFKQADRWTYMEIRRKMAG